MPKLMKMQDIIEEIKLELTGRIIELEMSDEDLASVVKRALREVSRFWDETTMVTVPFASCIDLTDSALDLKEKVNAIVKVYRVQGLGTTDSTSQVTVLSDPLFMQQLYLLGNGGTMYNLQDYVLNYAAWSTLSQIKSTLSTDMAFKEDRHNNKLYINSYMSSPGAVTIEYIPKLTDVEAIQDEYWLDILIRLSVALTKMMLGRIRTRFTQSNALWTQDGEKILEEGNTEYKELREVLRANSNLVFGID